MHMSYYRLICQAALLLSISFTSVAAWSPPPSQSQPLSKLSTQEICRGSKTFKPIGSPLSFFNHDNHDMNNNKSSSSLHVSASSFLDIFKPSVSNKESLAAAAELKNEIRKLAQGTKNGIETSDSVKSQIDACVEKLERLNPTQTKKLASDSKLDGSWNLVYTTNGGSSAGMLGPFVGDVEQFIVLDDKNQKEDYYINYVRLGGNIVEGALTADWDVLSGDVWQVNFKSIQFKLFGITLLDKELVAKGIWRKTYLDDDFRILYASAPAETSLEEKSEVKESIFILSK